MIYAAASDGSSPEITAAHRVRRAKRAAAREAKAEKRRDFLAALNLDLLTGEQQKLHAEYSEAVEVRDAVRKEILALRKETDDAPADGAGGTRSVAADAEGGSSDNQQRLSDLQKRLADAEAVIRSDAAEEHRALREAAARARGLDETAVRAFLEDLDTIDSALKR